MDVRGVELNQNLPIDPFGIVLDLMTWFLLITIVILKEASLFVIMKVGPTDTCEVF